MSDVNTATISKISTTGTAAAATATVSKNSREATKDAGRVHVGGGAMHF